MLKSLALALRLIHADAAPAVECDDAWNMDPGVSDSRDACGSALRIWQATARRGQAVPWPSVDWYDQMGMTTGHAVPVTPAEGCGMP